MLGISRILSSLFCPIERAWRFGDYVLTTKYLIGPGEPGKRLVLALRDIQQVTFDVGADRPVLIHTRDKSYNVDMREESAQFVMSIRSVASHVVVARMNRVAGALDLYMP